MIDTDPSPCEVLPPVSGELVPAANMAALERLDPLHQELALTNMLGEARQWLAHAVEATQPRPASTFRAMVATVAETAKQLGLSKEIQIDAQEMVRRAERLVGVAIRKGQAEGTITSRGSGRRGRGLIADTAISPPSPYDYADHTTLYGDGTAAGGGNGVYALADDVTDEQFDQAIEQAKDEGNMSRANVVRKVRNEKPEKPEPPAGKPVAGKRHDLLKRTHRHDVARIVEQTALTLDGLLMGLTLIAPGTVPDESKAAHTEVIRAALKKINKFFKDEMELS